MEFGSCCTSRRASCRRTAFLFAIGLAAVWASAALAQSGVLRVETGAGAPDARNQSRFVPEIFAPPRQAGISDVAVEMASHFVPPLPAVEGTIGRPPRTVAENAGRASYQVGYDAAYFAQQLPAYLMRLITPQRTFDRDWTRVANTKAVPYKAVCYIETTWPHRRWDPVQKIWYTRTIGTAAFVGRRVLLTNAHNMYDRVNDRWYSEIRVYPGRDRTSAPFGSGVDMTGYIPGNYAGSTEDSQWNYDIGWIVMPSTSLFNRVGYGLGYTAASDQNLRSYALNSAGYPGAKKQEQWRDYETKDQVVFPMQFYHYHDMLAGSSGSPMYVIRDGNRYVAGVNAYETSAYNGGTRLTTTYFNWTKNYNAQYK